MYEKTPKSNEEESDFEILKGIIQNAPAEIEREFSTTNNPWLACVRTQLQGMLSYLEFAHQSKEIDDSAYQEANNKIIALGEHVKVLVQQYSGVDEVLPDDIKSEILSKINILA